MTRRILWILNFVLPVLAVLLLWAPVPLIYKDNVFAAWFSGAVRVPALPERRVVRALEKVGGGTPVNETAAPADIVRTADELLRGLVDLRAIGKDSSSLGPFPTMRTPFDADLAFRGNSYWQLTYNSFVVPQIYLLAFDITHQDKYLTAARDFILGWWAFEKASYVPKGFLWNDHAIASRAMILCEFWYRYRDNGLFDAEAARSIVGMARHTARLLAQRKLYTYRTNHGMMQNIALAKLALTFAGVPAMVPYTDIALDRLQRQIGYFVGTEGIVMEHSAGYHAFGLELIDNTIALFAAAGRPTPPPIVQKRQQVARFLDLIVRPDGTLPRIGDTNPDDAVARFPARYASANAARLFNQNADDDAFVFPQAGYAVHRLKPRHGAQAARRRPPGQLAAFWGYYPHMGHKHEDELSVYLWDSGVDWWTAVGYWPNARPDRITSICWDSSNAPHLTREPCGRSDRRSRVLGSAFDGTVFALDLRRDGPDDFHVERQVISMADGIWLTLDAFLDGKQRTARIVWRTGPGNTVDGSAAAGFHIRRPATPAQLAVRFLASEHSRVLFGVGSVGPVNGSVVDGVVKKVPTFVVELPSRNTWSLNVSVREERDRERLVGPARMVQWQGPKAWQVSVPLSDGTVTVERSGEMIRVVRGTPATNTLLRLAAVSDSDQADAVASQLFEEAAARYGKPFRPLIKYRLRATWFVLALAGLHMIYLAILALIRAGRIKKVMPYGLLLPVLCWPVFTVWLLEVYFENEITTVIFS